MRISDWSSDVCSSDLLARDEGLERGDDLARDRDRIDAIVRHRGVPTPALARRAQHVRRGEQRAGAADDHTGGRVGGDGERDRGFGRGIVAQAVPEHTECAVMPSLDWSDPEHYRARDNT